MDVYRSTMSKQTSISCSVSFTSYNLQIKSGVSLIYDFAMLTYFCKIVSKNMQIGLNIELHPETMGRPGGEVRNLWI